MAYPPPFQSQAQYEAFLKGTLSPEELAALPSLPPAQNPATTEGLPPEFAQAIQPPAPPQMAPQSVPQRPQAPPQRPQVQDPQVQAPQRPQASPQRPQAPQGSPQRPQQQLSPLELMNQIGATYQDYLRKTTWPGITLVINMRHDGLHGVLLDVGDSGTEEPMMITEVQASANELGALYEHLLSQGREYVAAQMQQQPPGRW